jgi:hypothetical protein
MEKGWEDDRQALAKKSYPGPNSFFQFFIFWGFREDLNFPNFFPGAGYQF